MILPNAFLAFFPAIRKSKDAIPMPDTQKCPFLAGELLRFYSPAPQSCPRLFLPVFVVFALDLALLAGCGGPRARALDWEAALARAKAEKDYQSSSRRGHILAAFDVLALAAQAPDPWTARQASGTIEETAGGNPGALAGALSLATWESARRYLGDTHERAYASLLGGIAYWQTGEDDNAAALWRNCLDIDGESREGHRDDFTAAHYLLAKYYWNQPGQRDTAEIYLLRALERWGGNPYLAPAHLERDNLIVLIESGAGPVKKKGGPQGATLIWSQGPFAAGVFRVEVDGRAAGRSSPVLDLYEQARFAMRAGEKEALQTAKGLAAAAAVAYGTYQATKGLFGEGDIILAALAAVFLQTMPADTRQWWGLPAQTHLFSARVEPGVHTLTLSCLSCGGDQAAGARTVVENVEVPEDRPVILLLRPVDGLPQRSARPPETVVRGEGLAPNKDAPPRDGAPVIYLDTWSDGYLRRSSLYKYLPPAPPPAGARP